MSAGTPKRRYVDTKTRYQGVFARHRLSCGLAVEHKRCTCTPSYFGVAWDREESRQRKTRRFDLAIEAREARADLIDELRKGVGKPRVKKVKLREVRDLFLIGAREGIVLNKHGRRYRRRSVDHLESSLSHLPESMLGKVAEEVRRGEIQALVDDLAGGDRPLSGSRIRAVVNSARALYRFAQDRELVTHDPAEKVRLPAPKEKARDRVLTPDEFAAILDALALPTSAEQEAGKERSVREALRDAVPFALAGYGTARNQEIKVLDWTTSTSSWGRLSSPPTRRVESLVAPGESCQSSGF